MTFARCVVSDCKASCADGELMCASHWQLVPSGVQQRATRALEAWRAARAANDAIRAVRTGREYQAALRAAREAIDGATLT